MSSELASIPCDPSALSPLDRAKAAAFRSVFESQFDYVWSVLRYLGVRGEDARDVCQDVFTTVFRHLESYDPAQPIRPWLFAFAYHAARNYRRLARHRREVPAPEATELAADRPHDAVAARHDLLLVVKALSGIDLEKRAVFILHEIDGQTMPEVAATLNVPLNTAYSRLRLARQSFQQAVAMLQQEGG